VGDQALHVVATAGHVDHGKSALILGLTGMDPDRWAEEKRRGLTIDLGFAWTELPSGREVGFVDVPGHERFVRNMLAGVGPVRLVLFVVAADEGWKPQSEEHLQILDVLGVDGGVVALTKVDLVDETTAGAAATEVARRLGGTRLEDAPVVPCSSRTGEGLDELRSRLDEMLAAAPPPEVRGRPRQFVDRVFSIRGAGTVVTGTLTGGPVSVGDEAELLPGGRRSRIRGLQTHKRALTTAVPVTRVAVNLAGTERTETERGDVLAIAGQWRATSRLEGWIKPVRGLAHPLTARGAFKVYVGSAERDVRLRLYGTAELRPGDRAFARLTLSRPAVVDVGDRFVLREAGRRETVAGGEVLEAFPPDRPGPDPQARLAVREGADRATLAALMVADRGAVREEDVLAAVGIGAGAAVERGAVRVGAWLVSETLVEAAGKVLDERLAAHHRDHPLLTGMDAGEARAYLSAAGSSLGVPGALLRQAGLADALLAHVVTAGRVARTGTAIHLPSHAPRTEGHRDAERLIAAVAGAEPSPPSVKELVAAGFPAELIRAVCAGGRLVRVSPDIVVTADLLAKAEAIVRDLGRPPGLTVSAFRAALGTSRKYALPILEHFDAKGLTRRQGDVRIARG
jgi:selenocysteine-specific elongation factor